MSEQRKYRKLSAQKKLELVVAAMKGERTAAEICREHGISASLLHRWREQVLEAGGERLAGRDERQAEKELRKKVRELERTLGRKTYELEIAGEALRAWD